jgi:hypothetical protein
MSGIALTREVLALLSHAESARVKAEVEASVGHDVGLVVAALRASAECMARAADEIEKGATRG